MTLEQGGGADRYSIAEVLQVHRDGQRTVHPASSGRNAVCVRECARVDHCGNLVFFSRIYLPTGDLQMICVCTMVIFYSYVNLPESNFFGDGDPISIGNLGVEMPLAQISNLASC